MNLKAIHEAIKEKKNNPNASLQEIIEINKLKNKIIVLENELSQLKEKQNKFEKEVKRELYTIIKSSRSTSYRLANAEQAQQIQKIQIPKK